jgi:hypothetical protein
MASSQPDLLTGIAPASDPATVVFEVTPDFVARIRTELNDTLRLVREASHVPWPDLTRATLAELRFISFTRWLPEAEAAELRAAFDLEMGRLYDAEDRRMHGG